MSFTLPPHGQSHDERPPYTAGEALSISLLAFGQLGRRAATAVGVAVETVVDTLVEGSEAAAELREQRRELLDTFAALPAEEQNAYFGHQADIAAERRADLVNRVVRFPRQAFLGLFDISK